MTASTGPAGTGPPSSEPDPHIPAYAPSATDAAPDRFTVYPPDPYALTADAIEEPPRSLGRIIRQIGPGLILAGAIVGTGELIATTNLGAQVGFVLLWLVILSCFIKVFVQVELGRYTISSGDTTFAGIARLPGPSIVFGWWWVVMMLFTQLQLGAMVGGVGQALHMAMPGVSAALGAHARPELPWAVLTAVATSVLLAVGSYKVIEFAMTAMVVVFTSATVVCVALLPAVGHPIEWGQISSGLTFHIPGEAIAAAVAMFGITGVGAAELIAYPYWCIEKGYARKTGPRDGSAAWARRARGWMRVMRVDSWVSLGVYTVATLAFYALGAAVLFDPARPGVGLPRTVGGMLDRLAEMYAPVMGHGLAVWFIVIGAFAVLYSTLFASTAANSRALADFMRVAGLANFRGPADRFRWVRWFCVVFPVLDLGLFVLVKDPVRMVIIGGFMQAVTLPILAAAAVYLRYRRTDPRLRPGVVWDVFLWLSLLGLCAAALVGVVDNVRKMVK